MPTEADPVATTDIVLAVLTGVGLAAACGFRVFVPLLVLSVAARTGAVAIVGELAWIGSTPALVGLSVATVLEIAAFYVPVLDNLLDTVATPAAALAGSVALSAVLVGMDPWLQWPLGVIAGAGVATAVHLPTAAVRGVSTTTTAGVANPGVATTELASATLVSGAAVVAPILVPLVVVVLVAGAIHLIRRRRAA